MAFQRHWNRLNRSSFSSALIVLINSLHRMITFFYFSTVSSVVWAYYPIVAAHWWGVYDLQTIWTYCPLQYRGVIARKSCFFQTFEPFWGSKRPFLGPRLTARVLGCVRVCRFIKIPRIRSSGILVSWELSNTTETGSIGARSDPRWYSLLIPSLEWLYSSIFPPFLR